MKYFFVFFLVVLDWYYCHRYGNPQSFYLQLLPSFNLPAITANIYSFLYTNQKVWVQVRNAAQAWSIACAYEEEIKQPKDVVIEVFNIPFIRNKRYQWQYCAAEFSLIWLLDCLWMRWRRRSKDLGRNWVAKRLVHSNFQSQLTLVQKILQTFPKSACRWIDFSPNRGYMFCIMS